MSQSDDILQVIDKMNFNLQAIQIGIQEAGGDAENVVRMVQDKNNALEAKLEGRIGEVEQAIQTVGQAVASFQSSVDALKSRIPCAVGGIIFTKTAQNPNTIYPGTTWTNGQKVALPAVSGSTPTGSNVELFAWERAS